MVWKCIDDLTGTIIDGQPHALEVCIDGVPVRTFDVAPANPDDLVERLGIHLAQVADQLARYRPPTCRLCGVPEGANGEDPWTGDTCPLCAQVVGGRREELAAPAEPDPPPEPEPQPAPSPPKVNGAVLPPDPEPSPQGFDVPDAERAPADPVDVPEEPPAVSPAGDGDVRLRAEEMLLDSDQTWTPKRVADETGLSLSEAREVLAKVRREASRR